MVRKANDDERLAVRAVKAATENMLQLLVCFGSCFLLLQQQRMVGRTVEMMVMMAAQAKGVG